MTASSEMTIPKSASLIIYQLTLITISVFFSILAITNIFNGVAMLASGIWLTLVAAIVVTSARSHHGLGSLVMNILGAIAGRQFVETNIEADKSTEIRFGYELLGHRAIKHRLQLDKIETVEWRTGQATDIAGRDMKDWSVCLWFDHNDLAKSEKQRQTRGRKPDQDIYMVGPARRKEDTEAFGLSFVAFLRAAGAKLVQSDHDFCYVRDAPTKAQTVHPT